MEARRVVPVLRVFSVEKAREFYLDFLGFTVDWEHRFENDAPLYMQVSRGGMSLHLSEHHGDGTPGSVVFVDITGLDGFHREITGRGYRYLRPVSRTCRGARARCRSSIPSATASASARRRPNPSVARASPAPG